jgi:hypothetical protein
LSGTDPGNEVTIGATLYKAESVGADLRPTVGPGQSPGESPCAEVPGF